MKMMDTDNMKMRLTDGTFVHMTQQSVGDILGVRSIGERIVTGSKKVLEIVTAKLHQLFSTSKSSEFPSVADLKKVLMQKYNTSMTKEEEETFMIAFAGYCCAYMFGPPERSACVPKRI